MSLKSASKNGKNVKNVSISAKNKHFVWFRTFISALMTLVSAGKNGKNAFISSGFKFQIGALITNKQAQHGQHNNQ